MFEISNQLILANLIAKAPILFASITTKCACYETKKTGGKNTFMCKLYRYLFADLQNFSANTFVFNRNIAIIYLIIFTAE
jgi:hypothetical protein